MLIEAARRAEAAAKETLSLVNDGSASCTELREMLAVTKATMAILSAAQTSAAASIAGRERHGDGGTQVLADTAGLSRRDAHSQVKTARVIEAAPALRDAVETGQVSQANAKRLAEAIEKTSAEAVTSDGELLAKAQSMRPEQFGREARRWTADRQDDGGEADYRRLRAKRCVRVWDADDGTVQLQGTFDPVAGRRIGNRLRAEAARLYDADKKQSPDSGKSERRTFDQCMADALDNLTNVNSSRDSHSGSGKPFADICVVAHLDEATGKLVAETPEGQRLPESVLEELACNAKFTGVLYDREGKPIWRAHSVRAATEAQRQILFARYGGCFHCAAHPGLCQIHHIKPVSQGGLTKISNMVPVCWDCHQKIHHHNWQIRTRGGEHSLQPPDRVTYGPAYAPERLVLHLPDNQHRAVRSPEQPAPRRPGAGHDSDPPRPPTGTSHTTEQPTLSLPEVTHDPDPQCREAPNPAETGTHKKPTIRPGPSEARAALRRAKAKRDARSTDLEHPDALAYAPTGPPVR